MSLQSVVLDTPDGISARLGWDPATTVHDRRRILAKELIAERLGCDVKDISVVREEPRGFGYHTQLIASRDGVELPIAIKTASYRAATIVAICDPGLPLGIDIRDLHPDADELRRMRKHSHLLDESNVPVLVKHWTNAQAVLEADGRNNRVAPDHVRLNSTHTKGWIPDRSMQYALVDASRDAWVITLAYGLLPKE
ncbi:hypothetical protein ACQ143_08240 [Microbacterium sp. MC2]